MKKVLSFFCLLLIVGCSSSQESLISTGEVFKNLSQITFGEGTNFSPQISQDGKKLIYVSKRSGSYNIYLKNNPLDKSEVQKTNFTSDSIDPTFSSDGSRFAFSSNRNGNYDIYIMNTEKGFAATQVTSSENDEVSPNWSPNGDLVIFSQYSTRDMAWYIWTKNLNNGQLTQICKGTLPVFAPDGKSFYYKKTDKSSNYQLYKIELDGENDTQLTTSSDWGVGTYCVSPDGNRILFSTVKNSREGFKLNDDGLDLWALDLANGNLIQVTTHKGSDFSPCWAQTGDIYFASDRLGDINIWSFKANF